MMKFFRSNSSSLSREALSPPRRTGLVAIGALLGALITGGGTLLANRIDRQIAYEHRLHDQHSRDVMRIHQLEAQRNFMINHARRQQQQTLLHALFPRAR
ncbi:MAG: hypothetical protein QM831_42430 [Kofleriaceae bacterium]